MSVGHFSGGQMSQHPTLSNSSKASLNSACCILSKSPIINKINNNSNKTSTTASQPSTARYSHSLCEWQGQGYRWQLSGRGGTGGMLTVRKERQRQIIEYLWNQYFIIKKIEINKSEYPWKVCPGMTLLFMLIWRIRKECFNKYISTGNIYQSEWIHKDKVCKFVFLNSRASFQWVGLQTKGKCTKYFAMINKVRIYIIFFAKLSLVPA